MSTKLRLGGTSKSSGTSSIPCASAAFLRASITLAKKSIQMGRAATAPDWRSPRVILASFPIQTPAHNVGENPMNQASVYMSVVPVFPASGQPSVDAAGAVPPSLITPWSM